MAGYRDFNRYREQRLALVNSLREKGIKEEKVLDAMMRLPREEFIDPSSVALAYDDNALPIDCNQTISQPYTVAYMTSRLEIMKGDKILEIGTGSGYQAALIYLMGARVFTIERIQELYSKAKDLFDSLGYSINTRFGDGSIGWNEFTPYDGIIVTAAAPDIPKTLLNQLAVGGRLIIPVGNREIQKMYIIRKTAEKEFKTETTDQFKFVPLIGKEGWSEY